MRIQFMTDVCNQLKKDYPDLEVELKIDETFKKYTFYINECFISIYDYDLFKDEIDFTPEDVVEIIMSEYEYLLNKTLSN